jgi:hypothetical protein
MPRFRKFALLPQIFIDLLLARRRQNPQKVKHFFDVFYVEHCPGKLARFLPTGLEMEAQKTRRSG